MEIEGNACFGGFWKAFLCTNKTVSTTPNAAETDHIEQCEEKAIGLIFKTITLNLRIKMHEAVTKPAARTTTPTVPTAKLYWDYLKAKLEKADGISSLLDLTALVETKFVDDSTLETQLNLLDTIRSHCVLNGITFEDWQYAALLLVKLPDTYKFISNSFLTTGQVNKLITSTITTKIIETEIC